MIPSADVFGLFITIGGIGNLAHWFVGGVGEKLGPRRTTPAAIIRSTRCYRSWCCFRWRDCPCLHAIRKRERGAESEAS